MTNQKVIDAIKQAHEEYQALKGGSGSGNFGHSGRPGKLGGSSGGGKGGGGMSDMTNVKTHETKHGYQVQVGETGDGFAYRFTKGNVDSGTVGGFNTRQEARAAGSKQANNHWSDIKAGITAKLVQEAVARGEAPPHGFHY